MLLQFLQHLIHPLSTASAGDTKHTSRGNRAFRPAPRKGSRKAQSTMPLTSADIDVIVRGSTAYRCGRPFDEHEDELWQCGWLARRTAEEAKADGRFPAKH